MKRKGSFLVWILARERGGQRWRPFLPAQRPQARLGSHADRSDIEACGPGLQKQERETCRRAAAVSKLLPAPFRKVVDCLDERLSPKAPGVKQRSACTDQPTRPAGAAYTRSSAGNTCLRCSPLGGPYLFETRQCPLGLSDPASQQACAQFLF